MSMKENLHVGLKNYMYINEWRFFTCELVSVGVTAKMHCLNKIPYVYCIYIGLPSIFLHFSQEVNYKLLALFKELFVIIIIIMGTDVLYWQ